MERWSLKLRKASWRELVFEIMSIIPPVVYSGIVDNFRSRVEKVYSGFFSF